jgi:hypothetical protein
VRVYAGELERFDRWLAEGEGRMIASATWRLATSRSARHKRGVVLGDIRALCR